MKAPPINAVTARQELPAALHRAAEHLRERRDLNFLNDEPEVFTTFQLATLIERLANQLASGDVSVGRVWHGSMRFSTTTKAAVLSPRKALAIEEERAKQLGQAKDVEPNAAIPKLSETFDAESRNDTNAAERAKELERQNRDLEITNRMKDAYIERMPKDQEKNMDRMIGLSRYVGQLETQVLQLGGRTSGGEDLPSLASEQQS